MEVPDPVAAERVPVHQNADHAVTLSVKESTNSDIGNVGPLSCHSQLTRGGIFYLIYCVSQQLVGRVFVCLLLELAS